MSSWLEAITGPLNTATKTLQELMEVRDLVKFGDTFRKMHGEILAAMGSAAAGYRRELSLLEDISALKTKVADFETWDTEKERYDLKPLGWGAYAYMLKPEGRGPEPAHWVCTNCYGNKRISIIQRAFKKGDGYAYLCPACHADINPSDEAFENGVIKWLD
jgi:hypothetical protein